jgi:hypothetical protein
MSHYLCISLKSLSIIIRHSVSSYHLANIMAWFAKLDDSDSNRPSWIRISQRRSEFHLIYVAKRFAKSSTKMADMLKLVANSDIIVVVSINCCKGRRES